MDPKQIVSRFQHLVSTLRPAQMATIGVAFVGVIALVTWAAYWLNTPNYRVLFADMEPDAASQVADRLEAQKTRFLVDPGGRSIRVPAGEVDRLRLEFAAQGMPTSGRIGFELFDQTSFGDTEFREQVKYRRALEGEIARTISSLTEVASARVHIAMAKDSLFADRERPAKASVVLKLRNQARPLAPATAHGIASLVAAGVEGLRAEAVVIMDTFGRPLSRAPEGGETPLDALELERQQRVERDLVGKVHAQLEPIVGAGRVRVNVAARLTQETEEETAERWDPATPVVRSRQTSADNAAGPTVAQGIAGARGNLPPAAVTPPDASTASSGPVAPAAVVAAAAGVLPPGTVGRAAETTNFEISRTTVHTVRPRGEVARLSVAVIVDHAESETKARDGSVTRTKAPRSAEEMQKLQRIVAAAVGLDEARGDQLILENVAFDEPGVEAVPEPGLLERVGPTAMEVGRIVAVVLLGLFAFLFVVRPVLTRALPPVRIAQPLPAGLPNTVAALEQSYEAELQAVEAKATEPRKLTVLGKRIAQLAEHDPESSARLVRTWIGDDEPARR